jgi:tetratricopeptide (TPR) repeat protein
MMRPMLLFAVLAAAAVAAAQAPPPASEGRRIALVIGNDAYPSGALQNAVNDARAMQKSLAGAGFRVILAENANKVAMEQQAAEFLQSIGPGDTALFFFAGHAVQIENENLLLPVDFTPGRTVIESKFRSMSLAMIFDYLKRSRPKTTIVIIDACRSNPASEGHSLQAGLAIPQNAGRETYISFSTSPNNVASDNPDGRNSWFTEALAAQIAEPGLTIDDVLTRVRLKVESATGGAQTPWSQTSLTSKFYFHPPAGAEEETGATMAAKWLDDALTFQQQGDWAEAIEYASRVVKAKPGGQVEETAKARLPYLAARNQAKSLFEKGDYATALAGYQRALELDRFDYEAAFEAASAALLADQFGPAAAALEAVRARGPSPEAKRAEAMLKEIGAVEPAAAAALKSGPPEPPPIRELFPSQRFGAPDFESAQSVGRRPAGVDFAAIAKTVVPVVARRTPPPPPPSPPAGEAPAAPGPIDPNMMRVEIRSASGVATRDLVLEGFGEIAFVSDLQEVAILVNGQPVTRKLPFTVRLGAGVYEVKVLSSGNILTERQVEVRQGQRTELVVK